MMEKLIPKDQFDKEIKVGDFITYPVAGSGGSIYVRNSIVESIEYIESYKYEFVEGERKRIPILEPRLHIVGKSTGYSGDFRGFYKSCVYRYDRATIIERNCSYLGNGNVVTYCDISGFEIKVA